MIDDPLLIEVDLTSAPFSDSIYYISDRAYSGSNFYNPYLLKVPSFSKGNVESGFLKISLGSISFTNDPCNLNHPFYFSRVETLLTNQILIPFSIRLGETTNPFFKGNLVLSNISQNEIYFDIYDEAVSLETILLLKKALNETHVICSGFTGYAGDLVVTTATNHGLIEGQSIIFDSLQTVCSELEYVEVLDNFYTVEPQDETSFKIKDRYGVQILGSDFSIIDDISIDFTVSVDSTFRPDWEIPTGIVFTIDDGITMTIDSLNTSATGQPEAKPLSFGRVDHLTPVIYRNKANGLIVNPDLDLSSDDSNNPIPDVFLNLFEDGVLQGSAETASSKTFATAPTSSIITNDSGLEGQVSLSGVSTNGTSITDFFETFLLGRVKIEGQTLTINKDKAPYSESLIAGFEIFADGLGGSFSSLEDPILTTSALVTRDIIIDTPTTIADGVILTIGSGVTLTITQQENPSIQPAFINALSFYETKQQNLLEFAGRVARFVNHQIYIKNDVLYLIDRAHIPETGTTIQEHETLSTNFNFNPPISTIKADWTINEPSGEAVTGATPEQGFPELISVDRSASIQLLGQGRELSIDVYHQDVPETQSYLTNILYIDRKPVSEIKINRIDQDLTFGDRLFFSDSKTGITSDMIIRKIDYNFQDRTSTFSGDSVLSQLERS